MSGIVIVGVDGSETAARAAAAAYKLAQGLEARLHVITAFDKDNVEVVGSGSDTFIMSDADDAQRVAKQVAEGLGSDVEYLSARGKPADALLSEAERAALEEGEELACCTPSKKPCRAGDRPTVVSASKLSIWLIWP